jgi:hypothetical protein
MEPLETLATFNKQWKAELVRRWLTDEGISAHLLSIGPQDENISEGRIDAKSPNDHVSAPWINLSIEDEVKVIVQVAREDLGRAQAVLALHPSESEEDAALPVSAITDSPGRVSKRADVEIIERTISEQDQIVQNAFLAAIFGFVIVPPLCHLYSLILLSRLSQARGPLSERGRRFLLFTIIIDAIVVGVVLGILFLFCGGFRGGDLSERRLRL